MRNLVFIRIIVSERLRTAISITILSYLEGSPQYYVCQSHSYGLEYHLWWFYQLFKCALSHHNWLLFPHLPYTSIISDHHYSGCINQIVDYILMCCWGIIRILLLFGDEINIHHLSLLKSVMFLRLRVELELEWYIVYHCNQVNY